MFILKLFKLKDFASENSENSEFHNKLDEPKIQVNPQQNIFNLTKLNINLIKPRTDIYENDKWKDNTVLYEYDTSFKAEDQEEFQVAIGHIKSQTCIKFGKVQETNGTHIILKRNDSLCTSVPFGGGHAIFGGKCINRQIFVKEILKILYFGQEHNRFDRDDWVEVNSNCKQYLKSDPKKFIPQELMYDYNSVSHDHCNSTCLKPKKKGVYECGFINGLNVLDIDKINAYYQCKGCLGHRWKNRKNDIKAPFRSGNLNKYVCRAFYQGEIVPGQGNPKDGCTVIGFNKTETTVNTTEEFEILTSENNTNLQWEKSSDNKILKGAIKGGRTEGVRTLPLYIARCENGQSNYKFVKITQSTTDEILFIGPNGTKWDKDKCQILTCSS